MADDEARSEASGTYLRTSTNALKTVRTPLTHKEQRRRYPGPHPIPGLDLGRSGRCVGYLSPLEVTRAPTVCRRAPAQPDARALATRGGVCHGVAASLWAPEEEI